LQKCILLTNDLGRNFQDGLCPLQQRLHQPVRTRHSLGQKDLVVLLRLRRDLGVESFVDQYPRHRFGVQLDDPASVRQLPHQQIRHHKLRRRGVPGRTRLWIQRPDLSDHVGQVFGIDAAQRHQPLVLALGQQLQIVQQRLHRRIQAVAFGQLRRQTFAQVEGEQPHRIETHHPRPDGFHPFQRQSHGLRDRPRISGQPAGGAQQGDQMRPDHAVHHVGKIQPQLLAQVVPQGAVVAGEIVDAAVVALETMAAAAAAIHPPNQRGAVTRAAGIVGFGMFGIQGGAGVGRQRFGSRRIGGVHDRRIARLDLVQGRPFADRRFGGVVVFQEWIALHLLLDEGVRFNIGELQKLDCLTQLRRHDKCLALA
jgi:hypothetical protein